MVTFVDDQSEEVSLARWLVAGVVAMPLSIFLHEMAHFIAAHLVGATEVEFNWVAIEAETGSIGPTARGFIGLAGPALTLGLIVGAWAHSRKHFNAVVWALGLVAGLRSLVSLAYVIRTILGKADGGTFAFDEYEAATDFGISPMLFSVPSLAAFAFGAAWFGRLLWQRHRRLSVLVVVVGAVVGITVYAVVGPLIV